MSTVVQLTSIIFTFALSSHVDGISSSNIFSRSLHLIFRPGSRGIHSIHFLNPSISTTTHRMATPFQVPLSSPPTTTP